MAGPGGVLLTGVPGVGKSTACRRVAELLRARGCHIEGFLTEELRGSGGGRIGFDVVAFGPDGDAAANSVPLARLARDVKGPRVGKYAVTLEDFESMALPLLDRLAAVEAGGSGPGRTIGIIDEIGKMELFSEAFVTKMRRLISSPRLPLLCTVALRGGGFIAEAKRAPGFSLMEITTASRDGIPDEIVAQLLDEAPPAKRRSNAAAGGGQGGEAVEASKRSRR